MRYEQLHDAVRWKQPRAILEVGTWNGVRAFNLLSLSPQSKYYGFDLFEDATEQTDKEEFNVKRHTALEDVRARLSVFDAQLFKGNTRETLAAFNEPVDFVWVDGGHSVETIRSDWENVKRCLAPDAWVFFDDYYVGIDSTHVGCNQIVAGLKHEVLPMKDPVSGGGWVQMVRVWPEFP
jgi:predicted O-methyltransferase YrrM